MTDYKNIKYRFADGVARITFNRPPLNILNIEMMTEINQVLTGLAGNKDLKLVVFSAELKAFSAGVDVSEHTGDKCRVMIRVFHDIFRSLIKVGAPTLAVVNGACLGGGCEIALFCDFVLAREDAKFGQPEIQVGVFPPVACVLLPKIIAQKKALELLLTGATITAREAAASGLITKAVPPEQLEYEVNQLTAKITALSAPVLALTKKAALLRHEVEFLNYLNEVEQIYFNQLMTTHDANEGLTAFLAKRKPVWQNK